MLVKICGITRLEDAEVAVGLGAEALGFVFWPKSPRYVDPERARAIVGALPPFVTAVSESGIKTPDDIARFRRLGYHAFLIGERFMACADPGAELRGLLCS